MRILIADDHELVRRGVRSLLGTREDWQICGEAVDGRDAVQKSIRLEPDVVLLDVSMPNMNGLEAARAIRKSVPSIEVLILTQHESSEMVRQAFNTGARGFVVKSDLAEHLIEAVETVGRHEYFLCDLRQRVPGTSARVHGAAEILQREAALQRALRESEERFRWTFEQAAVGMAHTAPDGRLVRANERLSQILGYSTEELLQKSFQELTYPDDLALNIEHIKKLLKGEIPYFSLTKRYIRKDDSAIWANITASLVRDSQGAPDYFIVVIEDVSRLKQVETELRTAHDALEKRVQERTKKLVEALSALEAEVSIRKDAEEKMRALSVRLMEFQDEERRRFSRDLHDTVGQTLSVIKLTLGSLRRSVPSGDARLEALLDDLTALTEQALEETRTTSHLLHPPLLDEMGFPSAARWFVEGLAERSGIDIRLDIRTSERIPNSVGLVLFRVLQEALANIHRHSGSHLAEVSLDARDENVILKVRDYGKGMAPESLEQFQRTGIADGVGLAGMRERVREAGGVLEIESSAQGTTVTATIPLNYAGQFPETEDLGHLLRVDGDSAQAR